MELSGPDKTCENVTLEVVRANSKSSCSQTRTNGAHISTSVNVRHILGHVLESKLRGQPKAM